MSDTPDNPTAPDSPDAPTLITLPEPLKFKRGAIPTPRFALLAATPYLPKLAPAEFAGLATELSYWLNDQEGNCVSAEEAEAKGAWSAGYCNLPDLFIPDSVLNAWVNKYGFANGAMLTDVMDVMQRDGFTVNGTNYKDGPPKGVDYSDLLTLKSAISEGPVKIAIDAGALPSGAGSQNGWYSFGGARYPNTDHCVGLRAYGTAAFCFAAIGKALNISVPVPSGVDPAKPDCLILYTWKTYGVVDHPWLMGTCTEAWFRDPTTPGQSPGPQPGPTPTPPGPNPDPHPTLDISLTGNILGLIPVSMAGTAVPQNSNRLQTNWTNVIPDLIALGRDAIALAADPKVQSTVGDLVRLVNDLLAQQRQKRR